MLTRRQQAFVDSYTGNATTAAIAAGYSERTAGAQGSRLLKNVEVQNALRLRDDEGREGLIADRAERLQFLTSVMRGAVRDGKGPSRLSDRLRAAELLCRAHGDFLTSQESDPPPVILSVRLPANWGEGCAEETPQDRGE